MTARARVAALLAVFGLLLAALTVGGATAGAAPYTPAASVSVSQSDPCHRDTVVVTGSGYAPGSTVTITIGSTGVGRATVGDDGTFRVTITIPDAPEGRQTLTAVASSDGTVATTALTIGNCGLGTAPDGAERAASAAANGGAGVLGEGDNRGTNDSGSGGLSNTGVAVVGLLVVAVTLVGAGLVLLLGGRRRRSTRAA